MLECIRNYKYIPYIYVYAIGNFLESQDFLEGRLSNQLLFDTLQWPPRSCSLTFDINSIVYADELATTEWLKINIRRVIRLIYKQVVQNWIRRLVLIRRAVAICAKFHSNYKCHKICESMYAPFHKLFCVLFETNFLQL